MAKSIPLPFPQVENEGRKKRHWTEIAETTAIVASGGGVALAIVFKQLAFALVPPIFALSLNIVNRSRRIQQIRQQSLATTAQTSQLRSELHAVQTSLQALPFADRIVDLERCVTRLSEALLEVQQRQVAMETASEDDREKIKEAFAIVRQGVYNLSHHTNTSLDRLRTDVEALKTELDRVAVRVSEETVNAAVAPIQQQLDGMSGRVETLESQSSLISPQVQQLTQAIKQLRTHTAQHWLSHIDRRLEAALPYTYRTISDDASDWLSQALETAKEQVSIVTPYLQYTGAESDRFLSKLEDALAQNIFVSIGWGRRADIGKARGTTRPIVLKDSGWRYQRERDRHGHYALLPQLLELKKRYKRLNLKLLGLAERLIVCDRDWALLGGSHLLYRVGDEEEVGLYTTDPNVVSDLVDRFNLAPHLQRRSSRQTLSSSARPSLSRALKPSTQPNVYHVR